jgi:hypothetical protein
VGALSVADSPRARTENHEHIQALAETADVLPPIIVHKPTMQVIDGVHRLRAAKLRHENDIAVRFFSGSEEDAFVIAVRANIGHGLPLSLAERETAAKRIITTHPQWSDRMIASATGLAPKTVADLRKRHSEPPENTPRRVGRDGRMRPVDSSAGRMHAARLIGGNPAMSLREVARITGLSRETVRDVRGRLRRHEDPLPQAVRGRPPAPDGGVPRWKPRPVGAPREERAAAVKHLSKDPGLKYTETGRALLRLLQVHLLTEQEWSKIGDNVPEHCRALIARLARGYERQWGEFADQLEAVDLGNVDLGNEAVSN